MQNAEFKQKFDEMVGSAEKILVTTHEKPDPDAIGCVLAVREYLVSNFSGKEVQVTISGAKTKAWDFLSAAKHIVWVEDVFAELEKFDLAIFLDASQLSRFTPNEPPEKLDIKSICIDHHSNEPDNFDLIFLDSTAVSASELVYEALFQDSEELSKEVAEIIMTGIIGDSGSFRFVGPRNVRVLSTARELVERAQLEIKPVVLNTIKIDRQQFELMQILVKNIYFVEAANGIPAFVYSYFPKEVLNSGVEMQLIKLTKNSFLFDYIGKVTGYDWGFVANPQSETVWGISFRSGPGGPNVKLLANKLSGGGHIFAAGGEIEVDSGLGAEAVCEKVISVIREGVEIMTQ